MESNIIPENPEAPDASEQLDLVTIFESAGSNAEMEALDVKALLEANGIEAVIVGDSRFPNLPEAVRVAREQAHHAKRLIQEALAAGPEGAEQAERAGEDV